MDKEIKWVEKNILIPSNRREMQALTNTLTVPVVQVEDRVLVGFSAEEYEEAFKEGNR